MAVMSLRLCRYSTIRLLCAGSTRAKHRAVVQACRCRWGGSSSNSRPVRQMTVPSCSSSCSVMIPTLRQIDKAVPLLSPWTKDKITCSHSVWKTLLLQHNWADKLTCDHDDSYASLSTHSDGTEDLFSRGVQHAHATYKGQVGLGNRWVGLVEFWTQCCSTTGQTSSILTSCWTKAAVFSRLRQRRSGGASLVAMARQRSVSRPDPQSLKVDRSCSRTAGVNGTLAEPLTRMELQRSRTLSGAPWLDTQWHAHAVYVTSSAREGWNGLPKTLLNMKPSFW